MKPSGLVFVPSEPPLIRQSGDYKHEEPGNVIIIDDEGSYGEEKPIIVDIHPDKTYHGDGGYWMYKHHRGLPDEPIYVKPRPKN